VEKLERVARAICQEMDGDPDQLVIDRLLPTTRTGRSIIGGVPPVKNYVVWLRAAAAALTALEENGMKHKATLAKQTVKHPIPGQKMAKDEPKMHPKGKGEPKPGKQKPREMKGRRG
jgi:hypothetical protein